MISGREKRRSDIYKSLWDLVEWMLRGRDYHRVGPEFLRDLEIRELIYTYIYILVFSLSKTLSKDAVQVS